MTCDVDENYCSGFLDFLQKFDHNSNTIILYFGLFKQAIKDATNEKLLDKNPCLLIKSPRAIEAKKEFLTLEELKILMLTDFSNDNTKRAFIFSCLTGLRLSDVKKLKWSDISQLDGLWRNFSSTKN